MQKGHPSPYPRFLLTLRWLLVRSWVPFVMAMCLMVHGCALTIGDLQYSGPRAKVVFICDKPLDVRQDVNLWAFDSRTGRLVTAADALELRVFVAHADILFEYDPNAPASSVEAMPKKYGLICKKPVAVLSPPEVLVESNLRPCPVKVAEAEARPDPRAMAQVVSKKPTCDPKKKTAPPRIHVCARPSWVNANVGEWAVFRDLKENRLTGNAKKFAEDAANADAVFVFDPTAPPETVYWFVKDPKLLSCPNKPAPRPYEEVQISGRLQMLAAADTMSDGLTGTSGHGNGKTTETSSPDGKGPPLTLVEAIARNLSIAGALAQADTSGLLKDPNGSRYGIPNGKNPDGPDMMILQASVGLFAIIGNPLKTGDDFIEAVKRARAEGKVAVILDPKVLSKEVAEDLAKDAEDATGRVISGKVMAESLQNAGVIMPYSRAEIFTRGWSSEFQAHHLLERHVGENVFGMKGQAFDDIPAIILTAAQHKQITKDLKIAYAKLLRDTAGRKVQPGDVWKMYQDVYKDPNWLKAIKHYFQP